LTRVRAQGQYRSLWDAADSGDLDAVQRMIAAGKNVEDECIYNLDVRRGAGSVRKWNSGPARSEKQQPRRRRMRCWWGVVLMLGGGCSRLGG
jgi:hypothetical protein